MAKILNYILSYTKLGEFLNGKKTLIGAALLVLSVAIDTLEKLAPMFPEAGFLGDAEGTLKQALDAVVSALDAIGYGFLTVGVVHKAAKAKLPES